MYFIQINQETDYKYAGLIHFASIRLNLVRNKCLLQARRVCVAEGRCCLQSLYRTARDRFMAERDQTRLLEDTNSSLRSCMLFSRFWYIYIGLRVGEWCFRRQLKGAKSIKLGIGH